MRWCDQSDLLLPGIRVALSFITLASVQRRQQLQQDRRSSPLFFLLKKNLMVLTCFAALSHSVSLNISLVYFFFTPFVITLLRFRLFEKKKENNIP